MGQMRVVYQNDPVHRFSGLQNGLDTIQLLENCNNYTRDVGIGNNYEFEFFIIV